MIQQIRECINLGFDTLIFDFADLEKVNKADIEAKLVCKLPELFDKQKHADKSKKALKAEFDIAVALFFHSFLEANGFRSKDLKAKLDSSESVFRRHLGPDTVRYIRLLITLSEMIKTKPRGLLCVI